MDSEQVVTPGEPHRGGPRVRRRARSFGLGVAGVAAVSAAAVVIGVLRAAEPACAVAVSAVPAPGAGYSGTATHYALESGGGNCSYTGPPADQLYVALSPGEYAQAGACGGYLDVTGPAGSVRVKIVDQCPECKTGHLDLSRTAFARIGALSDGVVNVRYRLVRGPRVPGTLTYRVKEGSSRYWLALLPDNHGNPVARLEVRSAGGGWRALRHAEYNYWEAAEGAGPGPFTVRLTDIYGSQVLSGSIALRPGVTQRTGQSIGAAAPAPRRTPPKPPRATPSAHATGSPSASAPASSLPASASTLATPAGEPSPSRAAAGRCD